MRNAETFYFRGDADAVKAHVKWCRDNLGTRGVDWDFSGGIGTIAVEIKRNTPGLTFYTLRHQK